jgi:hypothetical protein
MHCFKVLYSYQFPNKKPFDPNMTLSLFKWSINGRSKMVYKFRSEVKWKINGFEMVNGI